MIELLRAARFAAASFLLMAGLAAPAVASEESIVVTPPAAELVVHHAEAAVATPEAIVENIVLEPALDSLVETYSAERISDSEQDCLANAVYFEARGEGLEGQLAVAAVVLNRAASDKYPPSICGVVKQPAQFSFVRRGRFPRADKASEAWRRAVAIAHIARNKLAGELASNVLWYHANYVSPSWGRRLTRVVRIGAHIFYS